MSTVAKMGFRPFNAVDLVTLAVFAALYRPFCMFGMRWVFYSRLTRYSAICSTACAGKCHRDRPEIWGRDPVCGRCTDHQPLPARGNAGVALLLCTPGSCGCLYYFRQSRQGPVCLLKDMFIAGSLIGGWWSLINWAFIFQFFPHRTVVTITIVVSVACLLGGMAGAWTVSTGRSIKGLIA